MKRLHIDQTENTYSQKKRTPFILQSISILDVNIELDHFIEWSCDDLPKGGKTSIREEVLNVFSKNNFKYFHFSLICKETRSYFVVQCKEKKLIDVSIQSVICYGIS